MFNINWVSLAYYFFPTLLFSQRPCQQNIEWKLSLCSAYIYFGLPTNSFFTPPLSPTFPNPSLLGVPTMFGYCWKIHAMQMAPRILILTDFMILQIFFLPKIICDKLVELGFLKCKLYIFLMEFIFHIGCFNLMSPKLHLLKSKISPYLYYLLSKVSLHVTALVL